MIRAAVRLFAYGLLLLAAGMAVCAVNADVSRDFRSLQVFALCALGTAFAAAALLLAAPRGSCDASRAALAAALGFWIFGPAFAAAPMALADPLVTYEIAYFDMSAALTTTGGSARGSYDPPPGAVTLWRALCGWIGGFATLLTALAVFAGGAERRESGLPGGSDIEARIGLQARILAPIYIGCSMVCGVLLAACGLSGFDAGIYAMGALSSSGAAPAPGRLAEGGFGAEAVILVFLIVSVVGAPTLLRVSKGDIGRILRERELRYFFALSGGVALILFTRHWLGALQVDAAGEGGSAFGAAWGAFFTAISVGSTAGFESAHWAEARSWSGLATPGEVFIALAMVGGGVGSTAGGLKIMRAALLAKQCRAELARLTSPSLVTPIQAQGRRIAPEEIRVVWLSAMLYALALAAAAMALAAQGLDLAAAISAAVAALSNAGPTLGLIDDGARYADMGGGARLTLCAVMVVGRIEALVLLSLFMPASGGR